MKKFNYARSDFESAKVVVFGAETSCGGFSHNEIGQNRLAEMAGSVNHGSHDFPLNPSPDRIRQADNANPSLSEFLSDGCKLHDHGNVVLRSSGAHEQVLEVQKTFREIYQSDKLPFCLGGDHLVKIAGIKAAIEKFPNMGVVYLDAHPDCAIVEREQFDSVLHHCFLAGLKPENTWVVGFRQVLEHEVEGIKYWNLNLLRSHEFQMKLIPEIAENMLISLQKCSHLYVSVDLDGIDPVYAPAVEAPYPGSPTTAQFISLIHCLAKKIPIIGSDISEHLPDKDKDLATALQAARIFKEIVSCMRI